MKREGKKFTVIVFPGAGHGLVDRVPTAPDAPATLARWIEKTVARTQHTVTSTPVRSRASLIRMARGDDIDPYGRLLAAAGVSYVVALTFMHWRG
jgi:hypothetical protein